MKRVMDLFRRVVEAKLPDMAPSALEVELEAGFQRLDRLTALLAGGSVDLIGALVARRERERRRPVFEGEDE